MQERFFILPFGFQIIQTRNLTPRITKMQERPATVLWELLEEGLKFQPPSFSARGRIYGMGWDKYGLTL